MNKKKVTKILVLLLILGLIIMKACSVGANSSTIDAILSEGGQASSLDTNNASNNALNTADTNTANNLANNLNSNNTANNSLINRTNTNTSLPKTGTNENIIIGLMVICALAGIYAFKKVKDYNM